MHITVKNLHSYMIKPSENGRLEGVVDSVIRKVLISDTTLR